MRLLWCDLETTGLLSDLDRILELAFVVTDENLDMVAAHHQVFYADGIDYDDADPVVQAMHSKNGLWDECAEAKYSAYDHVSQVKAWEFVQWQLPGDGPIHLAGSCIHFDRAFLASNMPRVNELLHYRMFDVSTVRMLGELKGWPRFQYDGEKPHRAMADVLSSIAELKHYMGILGGERALAVAS